MENTFQEYITTTDNFRTILQGGVYEEILLSLMNESKTLFPNSYRHIKNQSNGECDFVDEKTKEKYDAKIALSTKQCEAICKRENNLEEWLYSMLEEIEEFSRKIREGTFEEGIDNLALYKIIENEIQTDKADENIIFFIPFTIIEESSDMIFSQFAYDILTAIYDELSNKNIIGNRKIYVFYFGVANEIVLRSLDTNRREYFSDNLFRDIIEFNIGRV